MRCARSQVMSGRSQQGIAAVEFALLFGLIFLMLAGAFTYWRLLQTQQILARATGEGSRMLQELVLMGQANLDFRTPQGVANIQNQVQLVVLQSLQVSGLAAAQQSAVTFRWTPQKVQLQVSYPSNATEQPWAWLVSEDSLRSTAYILLPQ